MKGTFEFVKDCHVDEVLASDRIICSETYKGVNIILSTRREHIMCSNQ